MKDNFDISFYRVIGHEGGFTDDPQDPGNKLPDGRAGCTIWGCTQATWEAFVGHQVTMEDMRNLKVEDVKPLYRKRYWDAVSGDHLPAGVDYAVFDFAINSGPKQSVRCLQRAAGTVADGALGPKTLEAISKADANLLLKKFSAEKENFYKTLPTFGRYGKGWLNRVKEVEVAANAISKIYSQNSQTA